MNEDKNYQSYLELEKQFRVQQEKYVYYIIALSVTCIGFSVYNTIGMKIDVIKLPLGLVVISWALSIFYGLKFLKTNLGLMFSNLVYLKIIMGQDREIPSTYEVIQRADRKFFDEAEAINKKTRKYFKFEEIFFFSGIPLFLVWHILEMAFSI